MRIPLLLLACTLAATPLGAQSAPRAAAPAAARLASARTTLAPPRLDARLVVRHADEAAPRLQSRIPADVVTRPRWRYPAIGAAIGIAAGLIHASSMEDPIGFPIGDPVYVLPALYGAAGAFVGLLVDSADRERAARR